MTKLRKYGGFFKKSGYLTKLEKFSDFFCFKLVEKKLFKSCLYIFK